MTSPKKAEYLKLKYSKETCLAICDEMLRFCIGCTHLYDKSFKKSVKYWEDVRKELMKR